MLIIFNIGLAKHNFTPAEYHLLAKPSIQTEEIGFELDQTLVSKNLEYHKLCSSSEYAHRSAQRMSHGRF